MKCWTSLDGAPLLVDSPTNWLTRLIFTWWQSTNLGDVQHALCFYFEHSLALKGEILCFFPWISMTCITLWSLLQNGSVYVSLPDTNQLREQSRCVNCISFWSWPSIAYFKAYEIPLILCNEIMWGLYFIILDNYSPNAAAPVMTEIYPGHILVAVSNA